MKGGSRRLCIPLYLLDADDPHSTTALASLCYTLFPSDRTKNMRSVWSDKTKTKQCKLVCTDDKPEDSTGHVRTRCRERERERKSTCVYRGFFLVLIVEI